MTSEEKPGASESNVIVAESAPKYSVPRPPANSPPGTNLATLEEYLALERESEVRHEFVDGQILAMAGETPTHNVIAGNAYYQFRAGFETRRCDVYFENIQTRVTPPQYRYPDVVALCGEALFDDGKPPALLNPGVIVEVLSLSTESSDRREKYDEYRQLETLTDYILISQNQVEVTHYARQSATQWNVNIYSDLQDKIALPSLDVTLMLADLYCKTELAAVA